MAVTSLILHCSVVDAGKVEQLNQALIPRVMLNVPEQRYTEAAYTLQPMLDRIIRGGAEAPSVAVFAMALSNDLDVVPFVIEEFKRVRWTLSQCAVLVVTGEDDTTVVFAHDVEDPPVELPTVERPWAGIEKRRRRR